jgi:hypothetical protein
MKKLIFPFLAGVLFFGSSFLTGQNKIVVYDEILFYDGYNNLDTLADEIVPVPDGMFRLKTSVVTTKLTEEQLDMFGDTIEMEVIIKAACDNYDRLGHVHLALVPKGTESYNMGDDGVERYELGRFITPFMNKNKQPDTVPYTFNVSYLKHVFKDKDLLEKYDFWMELDVFGVPYAANTEISGCSGRNDVFYGSLNFITSDSIAKHEGNILIPIFNKFTLDNYNTNNTDELYQTRKSAEFTIENDLPNCKLVLITSNHGANAGGEEYNRRWHCIYFNDDLVLSYKPGRKSCEEFRKYNTQGNGIYGNAAMTDAQWQSFSNWCPGDVIDTRVIELGDLTAGTHKFMIDVPDAVFVGMDGYFPLSLYFLSTIEKEEDFLEVSETEVLLHRDGLGYVQVKSNTDWGVTSNATWLIVEPVSENNCVTLVLSAENTTTERSTTIEVSNSDTIIFINVTQDNLYLNLSESLIWVPAEGGTRTFDISTNISSSNLNASLSSSWISATFVTSTRISLTIPKNETAKIRNGSVNFTPANFDAKSVRIYQEAGEPVSLINITTDNQVIIHPNPANAVLNINASSQIDKVELYSISGQLIYSGQVNNSSVSVNTSGFAQGLYIVKVYTEDGHTTKKVSILK